MEVLIVNRLNEKDISFHSLKENITMDKFRFTDQLMLHFFVAFAEFECNLILKRSTARLARGRFGGLPEKLTSQDLELLKILLDSDTPIKTITEYWHVSRTTIYRYRGKIEKTKTTIYN